MKSCRLSLCVTKPFLVHCVSCFLLLLCSSVFVPFMILFRHCLPVIWPMPGLMTMITALPEIKHVLSSCLFTRHTENSTTLGYITVNPLTINTVYAHSCPVFLFVFIKNVNFHWKCERRWRNHVLHHCIWLSCTYSHKAQLLKNWASELFRD